MIGAVALYRGKLRPWLYTWGADDDEITAELAGDELVAATAPRTTRAVTIDAPIARSGHGWRRSVRTVAASTATRCWSGLSERISTTRTPFTRNGRTCASGTPCGWPGGTAMLPGKWSPRSIRKSYLVLMAPDDFERVQRGEKASGAWGFYLRRKDGWTRLLVRGSGGAVGHASFDILHFVMEQKMMRGIRDRAQETRRDQTAVYIGKYAEGSTRLTHNLEGELTHA